MLAIISFFIFTSVYAAHTIPLEWSKVEDAVYRIEISKDKKFSELVEEQELAETTYDFKNPLPGRYFWRVKVKPADHDQWIYTTDPRSILISLEPLKVNGPVSEEIKSEKEVTFSWNQSKNFPYYSFKLYQITKEEKQLQLEKTLKTENTISTKLPPGTYTGELIQTTSDGSPLQVLKLDTFNLTEKFIPIGPEDKVVSSKTEQASFQLGNAVEGEKFIVTIFKENEETKIFQSYKVEVTNQKEIQFPLPEGNYLWTVIKKDNNDKILQKTKPQKFSFKESKI